MKKLRHILQSAFVFLAIVSTMSFAVAPSVSACGGNGQQSFSLLPAWYDGLCQGTSVMSPAQAGGIGPFLTTIALNIIEMLLYIVGYVSLAFIIWGGFKFMINGDNSGGVAAAKKTILNAAIGLLISIFAVAIINLISGAFGQ